MEQSLALPSPLAQPVSPLPDTLPEDALGRSKLGCGAAEVLAGGWGCPFEYKRGMSLLVHAAALLGDVHILDLAPALNGKLHLLPELIRCSG